MGWKQEHEGISARPYPNAPRSVSDYVALSLGAEVRPTLYKPFREPQVWQDTDKQRSISDEDSRKLC